MLRGQCRLGLVDLPLEYDELRLTCVERTLQLLKALHHFELYIFEVADPLRQGLKLPKHPLKCLGVRDRSRINHRLVSLLAGLDLFDVGIGPRLLVSDVCDLHPEVAHFTLDCLVLLKEVGHDLRLGEAGQPVSQIVTRRVQRLQVEQSQLDEGVGFQWKLLGSQGPWVGVDLAHIDLHPIGQSGTQSFLEHGQPQRLSGIVGNVDQGHPAFLQELRSRVMSQVRGDVHICSCSAGNSPSRPDPRCASAKAANSKTSKAGSS